MDMNMNIEFETINYTDRNMDTKDLFVSSGANFGNCLFHYSAKELFFDKQEHKNSNNRLIVRSEANLINDHMIPYINYLFDLIDGVEKCLFLSVGHQRDLNDNNKTYNIRITDLMLLISKRSTRICTRGKDTTKILNDMGITNALSCGCPSILINPNKNLGKMIYEKVTRKKNKYAFGIHNITSKYSKHIIRLCKRFGGIIILQDELNILELSRDGKTSENILNIYRQIYRDIFNTLEEFENFIKYNTIFFNIVPDWLEYLSHFDIYIGLKIHGSIAGLMAGIMSICVVHDNRLLELVDQCYIPYMLADEFINYNTIDEIIANCHHKLEKFDENRRSIARTYVDVLRESDVTPSIHLIRLSE